jgi:hypothetical protein
MYQTKMNRMLETGPEKTFVTGKPIRASQESFQVLLDAGQRDCPERAAKVLLLNR